MTPLAAAKLPQLTALERARAGAMAALGGSPQSRQVVEAMERLAIEAVFAAANTALPGSVAAIVRPLETAAEDKAVQLTENELSKLAGQDPGATSAPPSAGEIASATAEALAPHLSGIGDALKLLLAKL